MNQADIGLIGLAVMGQNLVLNMDDHGFTAAVHNRTVSKMESFLRGGASGTRVIGARTIGELVGALRKPRRVMMMVKAGAPVDELIGRLVPLLEPGDVLIDGGNSHFADTIRRAAHLEAKGLHYLGIGISGGEEGARHGPSIMPGGSPQAWEAVRPILQAIAARVPGEAGGEEPCCDWVGPDGAGHFVKTAHNGIEYGDMQLLGEAYHLMKEGLGLSPEAMSAVFAGWNKGRLNSFLVEITAQILAFRDEDGSPLVERILDAAGQKGTGRWAAASAQELGVPLTMVGEAVSARSLSMLKEERLAAAKVLRGPKPPPVDPPRNFLADLEAAVFAAKIISYAQGFMLLRAAAREYRWDLNYGRIAALWRGGCIIRSNFLQKIRYAYERTPDLANLLLAPYFQVHVEAAQTAWRRVVAAAAGRGIPVPAMSSALNFYDGYRRGWLPANLIQAQRDFFGAHTYERTDRPRGESFHTDWTGRGGTAASSTDPAQGGRL
ncbi:MAG: decarboxylating NADP(+)-dependent phosphogluconate dehydrogenase [Anaerolineales bacterium]|nr:decarboxylating NADP(+)-dependent phosphogluconate dehydrogenase [Anaerolineales bacterium]